MMFESEDKKQTIKQNVITINYRLNALGFMHLADTDATGNQGLHDSTTALKWIYKNAINFGGDNTRITISGESAGAWSVGYHLFLKESWPYFRNGIMQSGGPTGISILLLYKLMLLLRLRFI